MQESSAYRGVIRSIGQDYDDKQRVRVEVDVRPQPKQPKPKKGEVTPARPFPVSHSECVTQEMGRTLALGDQVEVTTTIRKVRALKRKGANAAADEEEGEKGY